MNLVELEVSIPAVSGWRFGSQHWCFGFASKQREDTFDGSTFMYFIENAWRPDMGLRFGLRFCIRVKI